MDRVSYKRPAGLQARADTDGWTCVSRIGDTAGIALDPLLSAIWEAAEGRGGDEIARTAQTSTYLVACVLSALQRAGLLLSEGAAQPVPLGAEPGGPVAACWPDPGLEVSVVIIHRHAQADLKACLSSVLKQTYPALLDVQVISPLPVAPALEVARLIPCAALDLTRALAEQVDVAAGQAVLVLDSQVSLSAAALSGLVYALTLRDDVASVSPRLMWERWPTFVVHLGDWRSIPDPGRNPYAGQLDVGQFEPRRWQEAPAAHFMAGLLSRAALEAAGPLDGGYGLEWVLADWCYRARLHKYHCLAAAAAVAYQPWPPPSNLAQETHDLRRFIARNCEPDFARQQIESYRQQDNRRRPDERAAAQSGQIAFRHSRVMPVVVSRGPRSDERLNALPAAGLGEQLHQGNPALTTDNVRAEYSRYPTIAPLPIRRRVLCLSQASAGWQAVVRRLSAASNWDWMAAQDDGPDSVFNGDPDSATEALRSMAQAADLVVADPSFFLRCGDGWQRGDTPLIVDVTGVALPPACSPDAGPNDNEADDTTRQLAHSDPPVEACVCADEPCDWLEDVDVLVCAGEDQRLYWLGQLAARGRLNRYTRQGDLAFRNLVMVLPSGLRPDQPAPETSPDAAGPGIDEQALAPLIEFCQRPHCALDRQVNVFLYPKPVLPPPRPTPVWALPLKTWQALRQRGLGGMGREMAQYIRWKIGR